MMRQSRFWLGLGLGTLGGWIIAQQLWGLAQLLNRDVSPHAGDARQPRLAEGCCSKGLRRRQTIPGSATVEDGIERIVYVPRERRFQTPILMQHGMWHGAWCWHLWQELFADGAGKPTCTACRGHAAARPRSAPSPCARWTITGFLKAEVDRLPRRPVLMGHSMGGALTQWFLKYVGDLPAAVLVAPGYRTVYFIRAFFA